MLEYTAELISDKKIQFKISSRFRISKRDGLKITEKNRPGPATNGTTDQTKDSQPCCGKKKSLQPTAHYIQ